MNKIESRTIVKHLGKGWYTTIETEPTQLKKRKRLKRTLTTKTKNKPQ